MNKYTEVIERYLRGEMSADERADFEKQVANDATLKRELEAQTLIVKGIERAGMQSEIKKGFKKGSFKNKLGKWMLGITITALAVATVMVVSTTGLNKSEALRYELNEENNKNWSEADKYISSQFFKLRGDQDTVIETEGGIVLQIPARVFVNNTGDDVTDDYELEIKEAMTPLDIMKAGLSTMSNGKLLETGGMFYINARKDGKNLILPANKRIDARVPDLTAGKKMMLFDGERLPNGEINWVNPKPMENSLATVDIMRLNFYPPHFLDTLKAMGYDVKNKKLTDSIYYSFACNDIEVSFPTEAYDAYYGAFASDSVHRPNGENLFKQNCAVCHAAHTDQKLTGPGLKDVINRVPGGDWLRRYILNSEKMIKSGDVYANKIYNEYAKAAMTVFEGQLSDAEVSAIIAYMGGSGVEEVHDSGSSPCEISPSRIRAIWDKKFNNTLLATREFEARLKEIFKTCNYSLLDVYVKNMDKKMYEIDSLAARMTNAKVFYDFYTKREGGVPMKTETLEKLNAYMDEKRSVYEKTTLETLRALYEKEHVDSEKAFEEMKTHSAAEAKRMDETFAEELEINMKEAYRQLGKPYVKAPAPAYLEGTIETTGWKNVDAYVMESTLRRKTLDYTDPQTGKKAVIRYKPCTIKVKDSDTYDRVLAYLIPDSLSSFQRMKGEGKMGFKENLNELFRYTGFVLAFKGEVAYCKSLEARPGEVSVELSKMSKKEMQKLSRMSAESGKDLMTEFNYQVFEQKDDVRRQKIAKREEVRSRLTPLVFPCAVVPQQAPETEEFIQK